MVYGNNILSKDASAYQLYRATLVGGILTLSEGGYARCTVDKEQLAALSDTLQVNLVSSSFTNSYAPKVHVRVHVETTSKCYNYSIFPVLSDTGVYSTEIHFSDVEYTLFTFEIAADEAVSFTLWEVCAQAASDVEVIIDGVKQSLPKLLYDYNTTPIRVESAEQVVGMITCYLLDNTDLQGHFLMNFTASDRCTVHIRFFDTYMCELFSPVVHTVNPGHNTIEVPHAYLQKVTGAHSFYVTAQVTNGYLSIPVRGILYTIDGGYLAERLMNPGMDVSDITIRQLDTDPSPSEIWGVGIDNNQVMVKKRPYNPRQANTLWEVVYVMGEGLYAAIEFDGDWARRPGSKKHTIHTNALPMIALVDTSGVLWVYQHGMDSDPIQIASSVTCISMVRGYKSQIYPDQDQGMILCWVQEGNVYYKQYAYFDGAYQWYPTEQLTDTGDIVFAQVHRLNDFRVGIVTQSASENIWYITDRTYVGQSVDTEIVSASLDGLYTFVTMTAQEADGMSFAATHNAFDSVDEAQQDFVVTFPWPNAISLIYDTVESWKKLVTLTINGVNVSPDEYDLSIVGNKLLFHTHEPVWGTVQLSWSKVSFWFHVDDNRKLINSQAAYSFSWTVVHKMSFSQATEATYGSLDGTLKFTAIPVQYIQNDYTDPLTGSIDGTANFAVLPITQQAAACKEPVTGALDGTITFTCELVGTQPI